MADLAIITPTRGRPRQFADMVEAAEQTAAGSVMVVSCIDDDDPARAEYDESTPPTPTRLRYYGPRRSLSAWTNLAALNLVNAPDPPRYLASLGDDHRPRTPGWDRLLIGAIEAGAGYGFGYGNDLLQGAYMPTAWVVSADVVRALGWMMLPGCAHMYVDTAVLELGKAARCITYRPDVVLEHLHPVAGKAAWDSSYRESNAPDRYAADRAAFEAWRTTRLADDAATILALAADVRQTIFKQGS